jgi:hypothetical protein
METDISENARSSSTNWTTDLAPAGSSVHLLVRWVWPVPPHWGPSTFQLVDQDLG